MIGGVIYAKVVYRKPGAVNSKMNYNGCGILYANILEV